MARAARTADDPGMTATVSHPARVLADPPAPPAEALAHFAARLAFECDPADVAADLRDGGGAFVLLDCRSRADASATWLFAWPTDSRSAARRAWAASRLERVTSYAVWACSSWT